MATFTPSNDTSSISWTTDNTTNNYDLLVPRSVSNDNVSVLWTADGKTNSYDSSVGSRLVDLNGDYIADITGLRIMIGGFGTDTNFSSTIVTYVPDTDVL